MAQSLAVNLIHLIYSTKNRGHWLDASVRPKLFAYQTGIFQRMGCPALTIGGECDHVHALFSLSKAAVLCDVIEEVKKGSSKWMKTQGAAYSGFRWQSGYGAFSVSPLQVGRVTRYIADQEAHHKIQSFQDEFRAFLKRYRVEYDERYVWD